MQVKTKTMGTIEVADEQIITIPSGLFGFEEYTDFALIDSEYAPLIWLQSRQDANLAFLLIDPFIICEDYEVDIDDKSLAKIGVTNPSDVIVFAIVTVPKEGGPVTANLQGPLVINRKNKKCMQAILSDTKYTTKHNILEALRKKGDK
jgi:flagellar assembly factor FliW